ncbi:MAG: methyltransferase family protein [Burkholderiales bacterium]
MHSPNEFAARGGWWVVAQVPVLLGAVAVPLRWGAVSFDAANALQITGAVLFGLGSLLTLAGLVKLGSSLTPFPRPLTNAQLRQSGVYGWVRHPVYGGLVIASLGWSLSWLSLSGVAFSLLVFLFFDRKSALEEQHLRGRFSEYAAYAQRVRKLLPWIY